MNVPSRNRAKGWRDQLAVHPACAKLPPMAPDELTDLTADIKANGLQDKAVVFQDFDNGGKWTLLEGRHRCEAMEANGFALIEPDGKPNMQFFEIASKWAQEHPNEYVAAKNVHRRHLGPAQKRDVLHWLFKDNPRMSASEAAKQAQASVPTARKVRNEMIASGDVEKVSTSTDTLGRQQPLHRAPYQQPGRQPDAEPVATTVVAGEGKPVAPSPAPVTEEDLRLALHASVVRDYLDALRRMMHAAASSDELPKDERKKIVASMPMLRIWLGATRRR